MALLNNPSRNHNNNNNTNAIGVPPPAKKRKRSYQDYSKFLEIISKLGKDYDSTLFNCLNWRETGVICDFCNADTKLNGYYTLSKPCTDFNYSKFKSHCIQNQIHFKRITDHAIKQIHPLGILQTVESQANTDTNSNVVSDSVSAPLYTRYEKILKAISLIHLNVKLLLPLTKINPFSLFYDKQFIEHDLSSDLYIDEVINSMDSHQRRIDKRDVLGIDGKGEFALALDGSSHSIRSVKIFDVKGWKRSYGPITKYAVCLDSKKSISDGDVDLSDLFTTDTGADNVRLIKFVVVEHLAVSNWKQLVQLAFDGASQNAAEWKGCGITIQRDFNPFMDTEWCMTHRGNLFAKNGWKTIDWVKRHFIMQQLLYCVFTQKIMYQLYAGICYLSNEKCISQKRDSETRFNSQLKPTENISKCLKTITKSLKYVNANKKECITYRTKRVEYDRNRIGNPPTVPPTIKLFDYWANVSHIVTNYSIELVMQKTEKFGNIVGTKDKDIVSNYDEINKLEIALTSFQNKNLNDFVIPNEDDDVKMNNTVKPEQNPIDKFMKCIEFDEERSIVRLGDHLQWKLSYNQLNDLFKPKVITLSNSVCNQIPKYFNQTKRDLFQNIAYLFDPNSFKLYNSFNDTSQHGSTAVNGNTPLDVVLIYFKKKKFRIGPTSSSYRTYTWNELNISQFKTEYNNAKRILFKYKNIYPLSMAQRLLFVVLKMEESESIFKMILLVLRRIMVFFSGIIDVERQNGIKKWMMNARRESMLTTKLDMILRIYCNSPNQDDECFGDWLKDVAKIFWTVTDRQMECAELDTICGK